MISPFARGLSKSAYLRLLEYQKQTKVGSYQPDLPLVLFISFSRIAAGLSLVYLFFPESILWSGVSLGCMVLATLASISHLSVPQRFLTMALNSRSFLVWEIRLAGALTAFLALQFLSLSGHLIDYPLLFQRLNLGLAILFLVSTSFAYHFETHPAWKTPLLALYYLVSAAGLGIGLRSIQYPVAAIPFLFGALLLTKACLLGLYRNHLKITSPTSLKKIVIDKERWVFLAFLWTDLLLPALLTLALFVEGEFVLLHCLITTSFLIALFLERILFFWVERPVFFLSFIENPELKAKYPYWIRG